MTISDVHIDALTSGSTGLDRYRERVELVVNAAYLLPR
jgi:hypothetical protein